MDVSSVVLVEGVSDQHALESLARRRGRDLRAEGISVVALGGATNVDRVLEQLAPRGSGLRVAGLCDAGEEARFRGALERARAGHDGVEALGVFVCDADLEDELIRALGNARVEAAVEAEGELGAFRTFQRQPAQRVRATDQQLRRFMGTRGGRKIRYARLLVEALDLMSVPEPLEGVLAVTAGASGSQ